jgi:hypothetical protein
MSSVVIAGDTSGSITLNAPAIAGTTTLTLPTTSGTVTTKDSNGILSVNGVQFPATQSASADANTLDDYEEGTWTPNVGGTATYFIQDGRYTKVGKLVNCLFDFSVNVIGTGSTTTLSGLPFTNSSTVAAGSVSFYSSIATAVNFISLYSNSSTAILTFVANTANATTISLNGFAIFGNSARVIGSITYQTS